MSDTPKLCTCRDKNWHLVCDKCGGKLLSCPDCTDTERKLKEARAEIERLKSEHEDSLRRAKDNAVSLSGTVTEYAGELLAKDALIEQMREALECMKRCENCISCTSGEINGIEISICESGLMKDGCGPVGIPCWKPQQVQVAAALAAERGEK